MARKEEFDREEMINAIWGAQGKVSVAAQAVGCTPETVFAYARKYATVKDAIDQARSTWDEKLLDAAEVKLYEQVLDGRPWAVKYTLATKGKARGYVERQEVSGPDGGALHVRVVYDDEVMPLGSGNSDTD